MDNVGGVRYGYLAFGLLVIVGLALVGWGLDQPRYTSEMRAEGPIAEGAIDDRDDVVAYDDLSGENQEAFDRARASEGSVDYDVGRWRAAVVRHDGQYYEVSTGGGENGIRILSIAAGWGIVGIGIVGLGVTRAVQWWRSR